MAEDTPLIDWAWVARNLDEIAAGWPSMSS